MLVIAHRGAGGYAPENTLQAFALACDMGAKAVEFDVHQSPEGRLYVSHDPLKDLRKAPGLEEVLELLGPSVEIHAEIKEGGRRYSGIEKRLLEALKKKGVFENSVVSSFDHPTLSRVRELSSKARIGYLAGRVSLGQALEDVKAMKAESVHLSLSQCSAQWVGEFRRRKVPVYVYTVNGEVDLRRVQGLGVEGIFSDYPDILSRHWEAIGGTV